MIKRLTTRKAKRYTIATFLIVIVLISFGLGFWFIGNFVFKITRFTANKTVADVDEEITFNWEVLGLEKEGVILFGDGDTQKLSSSNKETSHSYNNQGKYRVSLILLNYFGTVEKIGLTITIMNNAPSFSLDVSETVYEDEPVNISLHNISDSEFDMNFNKLTILYDFADGEQIRCKNSSIIHKWTNQGTYSLRVTIMDDQGALTNKRCTIRVLNVNPVADFELQNTSYPLNSQIEFNGSATFDSESDKSSLTYIWDFNDGFISLGQYVIHQYTNSGVYNVSLTVRDDDDASDTISRTITIENSSPLVNFSIPTENIKVSEGDSYIFNTLVLDDDIPGVNLHYWWNFNSSVFNPLNLNYYELGGWINSHLFQDDFIGQMTVATIDEIGQYSYIQADVQVNNIPPSLNIWDASVAANLTFELYRNVTLDNNNNFMYFLIGGIDVKVGNFLNLTDSTNNTFTFYHKNVLMSLDKNWSFAVNSTSPISESNWIQYNVTFDFLDGQQLRYSSPHLNPGNYGYWNITLPSWYDTSNYTFNKPITFSTDIFDPSIDTVNFTVSYNTNTLLKIDCSNDLPLTDTFSIGNIDYDIEVFNDTGIMYANINSTQLLISRSYNDHLFPVSIKSNFTIYPFININDLLENYMNLTSLSILECLEATNKIYAEAIDDDLGISFLNIEFNTTTRIKLGYLSPHIVLMTQEGGNIGSNLDFYCVISMFNVSYYNWSSWNNIICDFGYDNNYQLLNYVLNYSSDSLGSYLGNFSFDHQGTYLITLNITDIFGYQYSLGTVVTITSPSPLVYINQFVNTTFEDSPVDFSFSSNLYNESADDYRFIWDFGDGTYSYEAKPSHFWKSNGSYEISFTMYDKYGNQFQDKRNITIFDHLPEILGPYIFQGVEARNIVLDVDLSDSIEDELGLEYEWYDETKTLFSIERKPIVTLQDGIYNYTLIVRDSSGFESLANITINVFSIIPEVYSSDYSYSGRPSEQTEGFTSGTLEENGMIVLSAFGFDTDDDLSTLTYYWTISRGNYTFTFTDAIPNKENSSVYFRIKTSTIYFGEILVVDSSGKERQISFTINSFIDSNDNGYSDEFEERLALTGESISNFRDSDGDGFSDKYERDISFTNSSAYDSDGDGLSDGNFGELNFGTDPLSNDTDHDGLLDGVEILGWNITIKYYGTSANFSVNSNPLVNDTDLDGLLDYSEYLIGSDPRNLDSDNDGLLDGNDPYPISYDNDDDGLSDLEELSYGTKLDQADTDGDSINDGDEIYGWGSGFKSNPLSSDTDHDFLTDSAEMKTYNNKINNRLDLVSPVFLSFDKEIKQAAAAQIAITISFGEALLTYGIINIPDIKISVFKFDDHLLLYNGTTNSSRYFSKVVDIKDSIEINNLNYRGTYSIEINDTSAGCLLEQFEIQVTRYLDPNDFDTDDDGIMDGVETALLVSGINIINFEDVYEGNLTVDNDPETYDEYSLTIPYIGRVYSANLSLNIESEGIPIGSGNISITLLKEELNETYTDPLLIEYFGNYSNTYSFSFISNLNLSQYIANDILFEYYGDYKLVIEIQNSTLHDNFTLSVFSIITNTFIEASPTDTQAWITDPGSWDTDGDMWSDGFEIYTRSEPTNPLSADTDGDGALDSEDRDPLHDVMLEIVPIYAQNSNMFFWERDAVLEIVISVEIGNQKYCFMTPETRATEARQHYFIWPFWHYYHYSRTRYNDIHYYLNINDWIQNPITFHFELWHIGHDIGQWDTYILGGNKQCYASKPYGPTQNLYVSGIGVFGYTNRLSIDINTVALNKTNTIAIYDNTTIFNGHFQTKEKMNIIQLEVNDTGDGTPFLKGVNTIVIPTSLFTKTLLNAQIQNKQLDPTLFPEDENVCRFISIERDGTTEEACDEIDFVIIRYQISSSEAKLILDLLLTCLVNSTTNETAINYNYKSTKENDAQAVMMNLFNEVLGYILWKTGNYINSRQGRKPTSLGEWLVNIIEDAINFVVGVFIAIGQFFINLWNAVVSFVSNVLMAVIPFLADMLWLMIRAAVLIIAYIIFALEFIMFIGTFLVLVLVLGMLSLFNPGCYLLIEFNKIELHKGLKYMKIEYYVGLDYIDFFDIEVPTLYVTYGTETNSTQTKSNMFSFECFLSLEALVSVFMTRNSTASKTILFDQIPKTSNSDDDWQDFISGFSPVFSLTSIMTCIHGILSSLHQPSYMKIILFLLTLTAGFLGIVAFIGSMYNKNEEMLFYGAYFGCAVALLITYLVIKFVGAVQKHTEHLMKQLRALILSVSIIISLIKILYYLGLTDLTAQDISDLFLLSSIVTFSSLIFGAILISISDSAKEKSQAYAVVVGCIFLFLYMLRWD